MKALLPILLAIALILSSLSFMAGAESWEAVSFVRVLNFLLIGPLWAAIAFLSFSRRPRTAIAVSILAWLLSASCLSVMRASGLALKLEMVCVHNMKQIALALHQYEQHYGSLPPAYIPDAQGKPMHSWRVLILPFMEYEALYKQYDFSEPWDGPNNRKLHDVTLPEYSCPCDPRDNRCQGMTSYVAVTGEATAWPGPRGARLSHIRDGAEKTILLVEMANSGIHWLEPRDLSFSDMDFHVNGTPRNSISSEHKTGAILDFSNDREPGANVVLASGARQYLRQDLPPETVRALLTINGGEEVSPSDP
jgi:hypothetical protein